MPRFTYAIKKSTQVPVSPFLKFNSISTTWDPSIFFVKFHIVYRELYRYLWSVL
jgi:hypothetical protein